DKVVFVVDRREIDSRTSAIFKAYAAFESVSVADMKHTYHFEYELQFSNDGINLTTKFKLNSLIKELEATNDSGLAAKKIVYIIDEAHCATMGQMMGDIKQHFTTKGLFYGFTETPLIDENEVRGKVDLTSEVINTAAQLFG
ncbi:DEAD/DEAH box helicase family protein, partial [Listeria monocytogenes]|uniref:DEAD/DEAH box helicase family protein n=1 Tax=Listeria monocytogenes TaxID=1639 RepID=UPI0013C4CD04